MHIPILIVKMHGNYVWIIGAKKLMQYFRLGWAGAMHVDKDTNTKGAIKSKIIGKGPRGRYKEVVDDGFNMKKFGTIWRKGDFK